MANEKVSIFSAAMRSEFLNAYETPPTPTAFDKCVQMIPSTARFENYAWMSPTPGVDLYQGHRRLGKISEVTYKVENREYDSSFEVLLRDIEDDQTGGYAVKPKELASRARNFPKRKALQTLADGANQTCFDGTAFFADSHTIGSGDNLMTANLASNDAVTHKIIALVTGGVVKPVLWQDRKSPKFMTDAGTPQSEYAKVAKYWIDMEGACAFGHWWDAIQLTITDTPTVTELQEQLGLIETRFRSFTLPKALATDSTEYAHEGLEFNEQTVTFVVSSKLGNLMRQCLNSDIIVNGSTGITNIYKGFGSLVVSSLIDP